MKTTVEKVRYLRKSGVFTFAQIAERCGIPTPSMQVQLSEKKEYDWHNLADVFREVVEENQEVYEALKNKENNGVKNGS